MFFDGFIFLRRLVTKFARRFVAAMYNLQVPKAFSLPSTSKGGGSLVNPDNSPLRVVLFTRGSSGRGRSMKGEDKLVQGINNAGGLAVLCCDYDKTSLEEQLSFAYYADAVS